MTKYRRKQTQLLFFQLIFWPLIIISLYHSGLTPFWFDQTINNWELNRFIGNKTYTIKQKHNPFTDERFNKLIPVYALIITEGQVIDHTKESGENLVRIMNDSIIQSTTITPDIDKTIIVCSDQKRLRLAQANCPLDSPDCNITSTVCDIPNLGVIDTITQNDSIRITNLYPIPFTTNTKPLLTKGIYVY